MHTFWQYRFPIGMIEIAANEYGITHVQRAGHASELPFAQQETPLLQRTAEELHAYFAGQRRHFEVPLAPIGTVFEQAVWSALRDIPYGQTRTYQEIARAIGKERACRAVGRANHNNPIMILIPCHRVIGKDGSLTGYAGGLALKEQLLALERANADEPLL